MAKTREQYIREHDVDDMTFDLIDESTVKKLQRDGDIILPYKNLDKIKDERWNTKQMSSKLLQGILNGDSVSKIAKSLESIIGNNKASANRNARTMTTSAENGGRLDSYKNLAAQGVVQKKVWQATPDDRVRASHENIDGEEQDIDKEFSNGCMYPGDGHGPSEEVWNCRCSMKDYIIGFKRADGSISYVNYGRDKTLHDEQMAEQRRLNAKRSAINGKTYKGFINNIKKQNLKYIPVNDLSKALTDDQIIKKIGQDDYTGGSCSSAAISYCANKIGLDVNDFRGGKSRDFFSENYYKVFKLADADIMTYNVKKEVSEVADIVTKIETNKQFVLSAGKHITIIKRTEKDGLYYLELQSDNNGWVKVGKNKEKIEEALHERFRCRKTVKKDPNTKKPVNRKVMLIDVDSFKNTDGFRDALGYINTKQKE